MIKQKIVLSLLVASSILFSGVASADFKSTSTSNVGKITSINMIPTQAQYLVINTSKIKQNEFEEFNNSVKKFTDFNGNVSKFISSGILNKYDLSTSERGQTKMSISELNSYQSKGKSVLANFTKKSNSVSYSIVMNVNDKQYSESGQVGIGQNSIKIGSGYVLLVSYTRL